MNILFSSAGRRGYLIDYFREALDGQGLVHASNSDALASSFNYADKTVVTPLIYSSNYVDFLIEYCNEHHIDAIIPLFDIDLPVLSRSKKHFAEIGTTVVISRPAVVDMCNDKFTMHQFLERHGILTPKTFITVQEARNAIINNEFKFPLIIKPRWGMGSIGVYEAENAQELDIFYLKARRDIERGYLKFESATDNEHAVLIQEKLQGIEYGLDVVNDLNGRHVATFVKQKLGMRAGETDAAVTVDDQQIINLGGKLAAVLGHIGNLDVDLFKDGDKLYVLELNARFGGGYPFSHIAGADLPRALVAWLSGLEPSQAWLQVKAGVVGVKELVVSHHSYIR